MVMPTSRLQTDLYFSMTLGPNTLESNSPAYVFLDLQSMLPKRLHSDLS